MTRPLRACCVHSDLSSYHVARFAAAARHLHLAVLEVGGESSFTEFKADPRAPLPFGHEVLFPGHSYWQVVNEGVIPRARLARSLHEALARHRPDVVILKGYAFLDSLATMECCRRHRVPMVLLSESHAGDFGRSPLKEAIKRQLLRDVSAAVVGGQPHREYLASLGLPRARVLDGYDVVDNAHFRRGADEARANPAPARQRLGLPPRYLLASGRFIPKKNHALLLRAFASVAPAHPGLHLFLLGDGEERPRLEALARRLGIADRVRFPGYFPYHELPALYGLAEAFIHPSAREQWGLVVNEAMAASLPVIVSSACGCAPDLVREGENGWTFDPASEEQLAAAVRQLLALDPAGRAALGEASSKAVARFSPARFGRHLARACAIAHARPRFGPLPLQLPLQRLLQARARNPAEEARA